MGGKGRFVPILFGLAIDGIVWARDFRKLEFQVRGFRVGGCVGGEEIRRGLLIRFEERDLWLIILRNSGFSVFFRSLSG